MQSICMSINTNENTCPELFNTSLTHTASMAGVASGLHDEKIAQLVREEKEESARAEHAAADDRHVIVLIKKIY